MVRRGGRVQEGDSIMTLFRRSRQGRHRAPRPGVRYERFLLPPGLGLDAAMYVPVPEDFTEADAGELALLQRVRDRLLALPADSTEGSDAA